MDITTRAATAADAPAMCALLNAIIEQGGTTAHRTPFDVAKMTSDYIAHPKGVTCSIVEAQGRLLGFQGLKWSDPDAHDLPSDWGVIASFVAIGSQGLGVGHHMFKRTLNEARKSGVATIDATIRHENTGGQKFYSKLGFVDFASTELAISKKFEIDPA